MILKLKILFYFFRFKLRSKFINRETLDKWQNIQIEKLVNTISNKSEFYKIQLQKHGDWKKFDVVNKKILMSDFNNINTVEVEIKEALKTALKAEETRNFNPQINDITVGFSSGTSGNKGIFLVSENERAKWVAYIMAYVLKPSFLKQKKIALFLRSNSNLYTSIGSLLFSFKFFELKNEIHINCTQLEQFNPNVLVAQPSMLLEIAKKITNGTINIAPEKIISVAEVLEEKDKVFLEKVFNQTIHQAYQCTEGFLASSCKFGVMHFNEDVVKIEKKYLSNEQNRYHPIITDFTRYSQPIIRYELNDIIVDKTEMCKCGSIFQAIDYIEGRSDDIFYFNSKSTNKLVPVFPDFIRKKVITSSDDIMEYLVEQKSPHQVHVYINVNDESYIKTCNQVQNNLLDLFVEYNVVSPNISFSDTLPELKDNKLRRIKNSFIATNNHQ